MNRWLPLLALSAAAGGGALVGLSLADEPATAAEAPRTAHTDVSAASGGGAWHPTPGGRPRTKAQDLAACRVAVTDHQVVSVQRTVVGLVRTTPHGGPQPKALWPELAHAFPDADVTDDAYWCFVSGRDQWYDAYAVHGTDSVRVTGVFSPAGPPETFSSPWW